MTPSQAPPKKILLDIIEAIIIEVIFSEDKCAIRRKTFACLALLSRDWFFQASRLEFLRLEVCNPEELKALLKRLKSRPIDRAPTRRLDIRLLNNGTGAILDETPVLVGKLLSSLDRRALEEFSIVTDCEGFKTDTGVQKPVGEPGVFFFPRLRSLTLHGLHSLHNHNIVSTCDPTWLNSLSFTGAIYARAFPAPNGTTFPRLKYLSLPRSATTDFTLFYGGPGVEPTSAPVLEEICITLATRVAAWPMVCQELAAHIPPRLKRVTMNISNPNPLRFEWDPVVSGKELAGALGCTLSFDFITDNGDKAGRYEFGPGSKAGEVVWKKSALPLPHKI